ncbi:hypothetical protein AX17_004655 [Amanita inopinata Kibby_2008]|nr:hypothetical protein AX17_004655 [Amanita inopinata Kibby_2008]
MSQQANTKVYGFIQDMRVPMIEVPFGPDLMVGAALESVQAQVVAAFNAAHGLDNEPLQLEQTVSYPSMDRSAMVSSIKAPFVAVLKIHDEQREIITERIHARQSFVMEQIRDDIHRLELANEKQMKDIDDLKSDIRGQKATINKLNGTINQKQELHEIDDQKLKQEIKELKLRIQHLSKNHDCYEKNSKQRQSVIDRVQKENSKLHRNYNDLRKRLENV